MTILTEVNPRELTSPKLTLPRTNIFSFRKRSTPFQSPHTLKIGKPKPTIKKTYSSLRYSYTQKAGPALLPRLRRLQTNSRYQTTRSTPKKSFLFFQFTQSSLVKDSTNSIADHNSSRMLWQSVKPYYQVIPEAVTSDLEFVTSSTLQKLSTLSSRPTSLTFPTPIPHRSLRYKDFGASVHDSIIVPIPKLLNHRNCLLAQECVKRILVSNYRYSLISAKLLNLWTGFDRYLHWSSNRLRFGALNILSKKKHKKYFSHYTYIPATGSSFDPTSWYKIPDLSFSARGSLVRNTNKVTNLLPTDHFANPLIDELSCSSQLTLTRERRLLGMRKTQPTAAKSPLSLSRHARITTQLRFPSRSAVKSAHASLVLPSPSSRPLRPYKSRRLIKRLRRARFIGRKRGWRLRKKLRFIRRLRYKILKTRRPLFRYIKIRRKIWRRSRRFARSTLTVAKRVFQSVRPRSQYSGLAVDGLSSNDRLPLHVLKLFTSLTPLYRSLIQTQNLPKSPFTRQPTLTLLEQLKPAATRGSLTRAPHFSLTTVSQFLRRPTLLRYFAALQFSNSQCTKSAGLLQNQLCSYRFGPNSPTSTHSNLWSVPYTHLTLRKHLLQRIVSGVFSTDYIVWYCKTLVHFLEDVTGRRVNLNFGPFVETALTFSDKSRLVIWRHRVAGFQRMLGHKIFVQEALILIIASIRLKDPTFLANWIRGMLKRMSFWKYRLIFRYMKFVLQHLLRFNFEDFQFKGFKLRLKGKISVAGNARTRTLVYRVGNTSHSKMSNKVAYDLSFVNTFTGVMGFKLWFFY